jgi:hypothetical protein
MMPETKEPTVPREKTKLSPSEAFSLFMQDLREGRALNEWGDDLRELVEAVRSTGNPAEMQITLKFELVDASGFGTVRVMDKTKAKRPRPSHGPTEYIITADSALAVVPPEQMKMEGIN